MLAMMGDGDGAIDKLTTFLHMAESPVHANTLYGEVSDIGDLASPVIESPLSMMTSLQELSLQCFSGVTRVFPAVPSSWKNVSFSNFRTDGAFLISATREGGVNQSITIFSEVGGTIKIKHNLGGSVRGSIDISSMGTDILSIPMTAGQIVMLQRG
ncbi:hypothetical protein CFB46_20415 [Burkholderia sp. HI2761]|nr:hypothetical protein CFB46_34790 [Burkholderia sp. HI2761]OXJ23279.1 hypothetical protein CFB46_20415 [Burkholderia sp. HI2761]